MKPSWARTSPGGLEGKASSMVSAKEFDTIKLENRMKITAVTRLKDFIFPSLLPY
jgi:hypothetical protein